MIEVEIVCSDPADSVVRVTELVLGHPHFHKV